MGKFADHTDKKFNSWTVLKRLPNRYTNKTYWLCRCECGKSKEVSGATLVNGRSKRCNSCNIADIRTKHGYCKNRIKPLEYHIWRSMKDRCLNPNNRRFYNYGGRGIKVCDRWINSFEDFIRDIGLKPFKGASIDRIDNEGDYEPGNVRWATTKEQAQNTRRQKYGVCVSSWSRDNNKNRFHVAKWLKLGKTLEQVKKLVTSPYTQY